jgi:hypothetical protein
MTAILSYLVANFGVISSAATWIGSAATWLTNNWKLAVAALAVLAALAFVWQADRAGYQRRVAEEAAAQVKVLQDRLTVVNAINKAYTDRFTVDQKALAELKKAARETPKNDAPCLPAGAARRVQSIR